MITLEQILESPSIKFETVIRAAEVDGLFLEFGVATGGTISKIAKIIPELNVKNKVVYGFDSFLGLPEKWFLYEKGHFACPPPNLEENIILIKGYFEDTLPKFIKKYKSEKISFVHVDCDIYSATKCIFDNIKNNIVDGTIITFDEIVNYGGETWLNHEFKAFNEFLENNNYTCECIGHYGKNQAAFKMKV